MAGYAELPNETVSRDGFIRPTTFRARCACGRMQDGGPVPQTSYFQTPSLLTACKDCTAKHWSQWDEAAGRYRDGRTGMFTRDPWVVADL